MINQIARYGGYNCGWVFNTLTHHLLLKITAIPIKKQFVLFPLLILSLILSLEQAAQPINALPPAETCHYNYLPIIQTGGNDVSAGSQLITPPTCEQEVDGPEVDFDADGYGDLAIGIPGEDNASGAVEIIYGTENGLSSTDNQMWTQTSILNASQPDEQFGYALGTGDFNGDGVTDLVIGSPGENSDTGQINVIFGYPFSGLTHNGAQTFSQLDVNIEGVGEEGDRFGETITVGNFNGDEYDDVAIGSPGEGYEAEALAEIGAVNILYGGEFGLTADDDMIIHLAQAAVLGTADAYDNFGTSLVAADFGNDGYTDLAVGIPGYDLNEVENAGIVMVLNGSETGISLLDETVWRQGYNGIQGAPEPNDKFGTTLTAGDFDKNGAADLVIGVPFEDVAFGGGDVNSAGAIQIIYGYALSDGLSGSGNQIWHRGLPEITGIPVALESFGLSLVAADFNGDDADDLAVGIPYQSNTAVNQGYVQVFYSNGAILATAGQDLWSQDSVIGSPDFQDFMGWSLGAGDFDGNGIADLTVGVPYEDVLVDGVDEQDAGAVHTIYGTDDGLTAVGNQIWVQQSDGIADVSEPDDHFGLALSR